MITTPLQSYIACCTHTNTHADDGAEGDWKDASGTGMGEGIGAKDVSEQIQDEDQLLGAQTREQQQQQQQEQQQEQQQQDDDAQGMLWCDGGGIGDDGGGIVDGGGTSDGGAVSLKHCTSAPFHQSLTPPLGIEMKSDFDGVMEDVPPDERDGGEEEEDEEEGQELDNEMGDTGDTGEVVDERLWNEDDYNAGPDDTQKKEQQGGAGDTMKVCVCVLLCVKSASYRLHEADMCNALCMWQTYVMHCVCMYPQTTPTNTPP